MRTHEALVHISEIILEVKAFRETIETVSEIENYETIKN
jgi:hypothetical protein